MSNSLPLLFIPFMINSKWSLRDVGLNSKDFFKFDDSSPILKWSSSFLLLNITNNTISFIPCNFFLISISVIFPYIFAFLQKPSAFNFSDLYISHCFNILLYISFSLANFILNVSAFLVISSSKIRNPSMNEPISIFVFCPIFKTWKSFLLNIGSKFPEDVLLLRKRQNSFCPSFVEIS